MDRAMWSEKVRARSYEVGSGWQVAPWTVCNWLQEAAGSHVDGLGWSIADLKSRGLTWVLARLHVRFDRLPGWREEVVVSTWPAGVERLLAVREFTVSAGDGRRLVAATSGWLLVRTETRRPVRQPEEIAALGRNDLGRAIDDHFAKLPEAGACESHRDFAVRPSDLDANGHANNVAIITWMLEALPNALQNSACLRGLEVEFRAEALLDDCVRSAVAPAGEGVSLHRVLRLADGREVARGRSRC